MFTKESKARVSQPEPRIVVSKGLEGQDENLEVLQGYFREMQTMTVETSMDTDLDLLTFALGAHYFGVIIKEDYKESKCGTDGRGEARPTDHDIAELANIPAPITEEQYLSMPEKEKLDRWVEAFQFKMQHGFDGDSDDDVGENVRKRHVQGVQFIPGQYDHPAPIREPDDEPNDEPFITDKGKMREHSVMPLWGNSRARQDTFSGIGADHEDLINWPDDGSDIGDPPSTVDDNISSISDDEPTPALSSPFHSSELGFGSVGIPRVDENFGREYLEPDTEPVGELPPIPEDPVFKKFMKESALKIRDQSRARTVHLYEKRKAQRAAKAARREALGDIGASATTATPSQKPSVTWTSSSKAIGLVYLTSSQIFADPLHMGECNIGVYIAPEYRTAENTSDAINAVVEDAFRDPDCHRLQAILVDHEDIIDFLSLYSSAGFRREGTRRRAFFSQITSEWKDVTYLAILDTEWVHDRNARSPNARLRPSSLWDEILSRHQREQEEFIHMEEKKSKLWSGSLKRSSSIETVRQEVPTALSTDSGAESSGFTTDGSTSSSSSDVKRRKTSPIGSALSKNVERRTSFSSSESGFESDWEMNMLDESDSANILVNDPRPSYSSGPSGSGSSNSSVWDLWDD